MNYPSEIPSGSYVDRRYQVVKTLGQGGFGRTYLVKDERRFEKYCVLKEFVPQAKDQEAIAKSRELFEREAKVLNQLEHRQIPKFFGWFEENNRLFLVQQFVDGKTYADLFEERQQQNQTFTEAEVTQLLKDLLPVLQYIHNNHIIHRDISPDNIMLCSKEEKPILIDFGVVNQRTATQVASGAITAGTTVGKQSFSPVEQIGRGICFPSSDIYALAVTAMVLLTGKQPRDFYDSSNDKLQWRRYTNVSDKLADIIDKMSADVHRDRYQSAQEVLNELSPPIPNTYIPPKPTEIDPNLPPRKKSSKNPIVLGGLGALAIVGGLFFFLTPNMSGVCNTLGNCSSDIKFKADYDEIVDRAQPILAEAANDENLNTYNWQKLQKLKSQLEDVTLDLEAIPDSANIYDEAEATLADIEAQVLRVDEAMNLDNMFVNPQVNK
ncbi:serine/threonine protein kinase [Waterburya agarophytonicola K14]|uniref:non-specific serine/threonine protein kinase n=1 Tax=Waterburya agarophytonicola KI4 TaxID=2874699 RepID=A0A964FH73_9CYAN|nr:serine/threonine protein kinase [Waterburya agarophytonicola KI4]